MKALLLLVLLAWLPHEIALVWQPGAAQVELRTRGGDAPLESLNLLEPDDNPSELRLALLWRF